MKNIVVFGREKCILCEKYRSYLDARNAVYEYRNATPEDIEEHSIEQAPYVVIFEDGEPVARTRPVPLAALNELLE